MTDTAQPGLAAENVALDNAADAFKAFVTDAPVIPRDEQGRFAAQEIETDEGEPESAANDEDTDETEDAADEAQPEAVPPPSSWSTEEAAVWETLPADAQAVIAQREAERDKAVNQKFQEAANVRKANEAIITEANANRDAYAKELQVVLSLVQPVEPDPYAYGMGTPNYNRDAYDMASYQYRQQADLVHNARAQLEHIQAQRAEEEKAGNQAWRAQHEAEFSPKLLSDVPELKDPAKAAPTVTSMIEYAIASGIPAENFEADAWEDVTSAQLHILWKAQQYDQLKAKGGAVRQTPPPKPAQPAVKPGVTVPRSAVRRSQYEKASQRLASEGSIEAGAAIFKLMR